ncbi:SH3 domain-containing protein [Neptunomonas qingdaonensis]|uniref:SH3 domain-containing protein n=2 Tax=Neptunomonas qingdaonensis TaxID=1045558 RepID=A0A1I2W375_9GAMM|nr:SH3 domain-containing protein [Neptunomonas qingdaonensis]
MVLTLTVSSRFLPKKVTKLSAIGQLFGVFMRQFFIVMFLGLLMSSSFVSALDFYRVNDEPINVRSGPGKKFPTLAQAKKGEQVLFIKQEGDWANIFFIHPDGRQVEGWIYAIYIQPESVDRQVDTVVKAESIGAHLKCLPNAEKTGVSSCMLDIDFTVTGPLNEDAAQVRCESEVLLHLANGDVQPLQEAGRIRTPLKKGVGAARMQLIVFPLSKESVEKVTVVDYRCIAQKS